MALDEERLKEVVDAKLDRRRTEAALQHVRTRWRRPLLPAGLSALLAMTMLMVGLAMPDKRMSALVGAVVFIAISYVCFWAYRQNRIAHALAERLAELEDELAALVETLREKQGQEEEG